MSSLTGMRNTSNAVQNLKFHIDKNIAMIWGRTQSHGISASPVQRSNSQPLGLMRDNELNIVL